MKWRQKIILFLLRSCKQNYFTVVDPIVAGIHRRFFNASDKIIKCIRLFDIYLGFANSKVNVLWLLVASGAYYFLGKVINSIKALLKGEHQCK